MQRRGVLRSLSLAVAMPISALAQGQNKRDSQAIPWDKLGAGGGREGASLDREMLTRERINVADFLTAEQLYDVRLGALKFDCSVSIQRAMDECVDLGRPVALYFPRGRYGIAKAIRMNPRLDCADLTKNVIILGQAGHRSYDTEGELPVSLVALDGADCVLDLRASSKWAVIGVSIAAGDRAGRAIRFGAEDTKNARQIPRVGTIEDCQIYGGRYGIDGYLTSGFRLLNSNISRAEINGIRLNSCGDWEISGNLINNCGGFINKNADENFYAGAAMVVFGGGGNSIFSGGKIEVNSKGLVFDNAQGINVSGVQFDKNREFAFAISGNQNTFSKTKNLGYQPRSFSIVNCRFLASGWGGAHKTHLLISNSGKDLDFGVTLGNNTFARGGADAFDLNSATSDIYGVGPERALKIVSSDQGQGVVRVASTGNLYSGGATKFSVEGYGPRIIFDSAADSFDLPCVVQGPESYCVGTARRIYRKLRAESFSVAPGGVKFFNFPVAVAAAGRNFRIVSPNMPIDVNVAVVAQGDVVRVALKNSGMLEFNFPAGILHLEFEVDAWLLAGKS